MIRKILIFLLFAINCIAVVNIREVYKGAWGDKEGEFKFGDFDYPQEASNAPNTFYVLKQNLYIEDTHNYRLQIINLHKKNDVKVVVLPKQIRSSTISSVANDKTMLFNSHTLGTVRYSLQSKKYYKINNLSNLMFFVDYKPNLLILCDAHKILVVNKNFKSVPNDSISDEIRFIKNNLIYLSIPKALLGTHMKTLKKYLNLKYREIANLNKNDTIPELFQFPDRTKLSPYFVGQPTSANFLDIDSAVNTYWLLNSEVYVDSISNPDRKVLGIFKFNKFGKLDYWFPEPKPAKDWKHGLGLIVNQNGRIFRMNFHPKEGLKIVEYIFKK